jgi:hypothetical protein
VRLRAALLFGFALVAGCASGEEPKAAGPPDFEACGLPAVHAKTDPDLVPESYLLGGKAVVSRTEIEQGRLIASLSVPYGVNDAFPRFKDAIAQTSFKVLQEDNEGFEAELYLKDGKQLGSLQIRSSKCQDVTIAYLNLPAP